MRKIIDFICFVWNTFSALIGSAFIFIGIYCAWYGFDIIDVIPQSRFKMLLIIGVIIGGIANFREEFL